MLTIIDEWLINTKEVKYAVANPVDENDPTAGWDVEITIKGKREESIAIWRKTQQEAMAVLGKLSDASVC